MSDKIKYSDKVKENLKYIYDECMKEDKAVRERQVRKWKRLKLLWEGFHRIWFSEEAHDWRIWEEESEGANSDQAMYDKPINVLKAYLESIIAALSVTVPPIKNYPEDASNPLDLSTARASDKIAELIYRHNDVALLWLHSLFINVTEGLVACYSYPDSDEDYGTYKEEKYKDELQDKTTVTCPKCQFSEEQPNLNPALDGQTDNCPQCGEMIVPQINREQVSVSVLDKIDILPKTRVCMEAYGGLYVKIPNYSRKQKDVPYLVFSREEDMALLIDKYWEDIKNDDDLIDCLKDHTSIGTYEQWARLSPQYQGEYPTNVLTEHQAWIRTAKFNLLEDQREINELKKLFPKGVKLTVINDKLICCEPKCLDENWTLSENPLSDYLHFEPDGQGLISVQDITNDLVSLTLQTIEHGIGSTFVDPAFIDIDGYAQTEATPGGIFASKPLGGKKLADGIAEMRTATLSGEVMPFGDRIQSFGQLTSGALPSLFGGQLEGSDTASEYSMSRAQALQRQQNKWKTFTAWWKRIFAKNIPMFVKEMKTDEMDVKKNKDGNFINVMIERAELEGKVGKVELEANENLPITWGQRKDTIEKLIVNSRPDSPVMAVLTAPENLPLIHEYLGLNEFYVPGEDDVIKQYDEIKLLLQSEPIETGDPLNPEVPSIEIDPTFDNHRIEFEIVRKWIISEEGRVTKINNEAGYKNVLLHGMLHFQEIQKAQAMQQQAQTEANGDGANPKKPKKSFNREAPVGESDAIPTIQ